MSKHDSPLVSVIIALYNSEKYIEETIQSVLSQSYTNVELIIVDDCSTDGSLEIVKKISGNDPRVNVISLDSNSGGPAIPRNTGIDCCRGTYIAFLDSDDVWDHSKISMQVEFMEKNSYKFCSTDIELIDSEGYGADKKILPMLIKFFSRHTYKNLIIRNSVTLSSVLINRSLLGDHRFNTESNLTAVEDYYLWLELFANYENKCGYLDSKLVKYRLYRQSISSNYNRQQIRSLYCVTKHLINNEKYEFYPLLFLVFLLFFVKHLKRLIMF